MKINRILILVAIAVVVSCNQNTVIDQNPTTVEGIKALLEEKESELSDIEKRIAELKEELLKKDPSLEKKKKIVTARSITKSDFVKHVELEGVVIADKSANVVTDIPGRIVSLRVREGDYVKKGSLVAKLDMESYNKQRQELTIAISLAKDVAERQSRLWNQNIGSEMQYLQAKNEYERLQKSVESIDHQLTKGNVYAPMSGVVEREFIKQGELASPGMPIVQILNLRDVKVEVDLPERYLSILKKGKRVEVFFPSLDKTVPGVVSLLGRSIDPANRTLKFEIDVPNKGGILKPNLLANIKLVEKKYEDVIVLPLELVQQDVDNNEFLMVIKKTNIGLIARKTDIKVSERYEGRALVSEGLTTENVIVGEGARLLSDGESLIISE